MLVSLDVTMVVNVSDIVYDSVGVFVWLRVFDSVDLGVSVSVSFNVLVRDLTNIGEQIVKIKILNIRITN